MKKKTLTPITVQAREARKTVAIQKQGKLQATFEEVSARYIRIGENKKYPAFLKFRRLNKLNRQLSHLRNKLQHVNSELFALNNQEIYQTPLLKQLSRKFEQLPYDKQKMVFGMLFILPWLIGFIVFFSSPLITTIWWSLNEMAPKVGGGFTFNFAWFDNYRNLFVSETLAGSTVLEVLTRSIMNIAIDLPTILLFSIFIAVLLNTKFKGHQLVKAIFFIPVVYNMTVVNNTLSGAFGQLFESNLNEGFQLGETFSNFLLQIGIGGGLIEFLMSAVDRIFLIVNKSGIQIIIFIAALQSIPIHLYESAKVEGATKYEMFWKVTIPLISPMILTALVFTVVDSFGSSEIMHFLTVNSQGTTMATNMPGMYSAISTVYFMANIFIIGFAFLLLRKSVFYYD